MIALQLSYICAGWEHTRLFLRGAVAEACQGPFCRAFCRALFTEADAATASSGSCEQQTALQSEAAQHGVGLVQYV